MKRKSISIKMMLVILFVFSMITAVGLISYIVFTGWLSTTEKIVTEMAEDMNDEIYREVERFMHVPQHVNEVNQKLLENGIVDTSIEVSREQFFVGVLNSHDAEAVYSFSYGAETGEYYGARKNADNVIEIMRNNPMTGGNSWYYSVTEEMTAGERVVVAGKFDPRTRDWYKAAKVAQGPIFSPVYKHFVMDDLTVSAAVPINNSKGELQGVLGTHITLARIDRSLKEIVKRTNASAVIFEKNSGALIANSLDLANFKNLKEGGIKRITIDEVDNPPIIEAYGNYKSSAENRYKLTDQRDNVYINFKEYHEEGLDWIVVTAVPASLFTAGIIDNMKLTAIMTLLALAIMIGINLTLTSKFFRPIDTLIDTQDKFTQGDLTQRAVVVRNDEIGMLARSFTKMADTISMLVINLEDRVRDRTTELEEANAELKGNKDQLQLILDSTAEGIYGVDINGNCTFINDSGLEMLKYDDHVELIDKNIHWLIHHNYKDGKPMLLEECNIYQALKSGQGTYVDDEVFWRADGTSFEVAYYSYPQYKNGEIVGAVVTFTDNTESKKDEERINYLTYHDSLTGLYNRRFFEDKLKAGDTSRNIPISIIFGDVNGLKLTNDIFGHKAGDELLKKTAEVLKKACRDEDILARVGGDEFAILLTNTEGGDTKKVVNRVKEEFLKTQIIAIKGSISMGYDTKTSMDEDLQTIMKNAEDKMYQEKTLLKKTMNADMVKTIIEILHRRSPREKQHSVNVSLLCQRMGKAMKLPTEDVRKLKDAGFFHDIGKIIFDEDSLNKEGVLTEEEKNEIQQHTTVGYRILNLFDETLDLAEGVLSHHENWDGSGYPKGIAGEEIPTLSRIIAVAEGYDAMTNDLNKCPLDKGEALKDIKEQSGLKYDPEIVSVFIEKVLGKD